MTLIDTSVWVRFFKGMTEAEFVSEKIFGNTVFLHPLVLGELLLGGLSPKNELLLQSLLTIKLPMPEKIYKFIKENSLSGKGIGWVDSAILCSAYEAGAGLATFDEALQLCAENIRIDCVQIDK